MKTKVFIFLLAIIGIVRSSCHAGGISFSASSVHSGPYAAQNAFDGNPQTRWASQPNRNNEFLQIDFSETLPIGALLIRWENAYAKEYDIQVSDNGKDWKVIAAVTDGKGGKIEHKGLQENGRFLRINCKKYGPHPLYSIWEVRIAGNAVNRKLQEFRQDIRHQEKNQAEQNKQLLRKIYGVEEIIFAQRRMGIDGHWYANFAYYADSTERKPHRPGGRLCKLNVITAEVTVLLEDEAGSVRDPIVHYDAKKILFSYRKGGEEHFHLWEINCDGSGLRQLTDGIYDDIEPTYLPNDDIMFVSSRGKRWVNCWLTPVAILYRCDANGKNIRQISANIEHDNTPWVLPDGRIIYQRWEYIDRSQVHYHHLWATNPDGTNQTIYFGNMHPGGVFIDAKPIPGTADVLMIESPGHGQNEHVGWVTRVSEKYGPDDLNAKRHLNPAASFRDPYPLSAQHCLAASGKTIQLMDDSGKTTVVYRLPAKLARAGFECHEPRPVIQRQRETIIPDRTDPKQATGKLFVTNVYNGRNMEGVKPGTIKKLLVLESLPKPINYTGGMDPLTYGGSFTLERILGTIPVESDGSAFMELPANRSLFFITLDKNDNAVKRMQSFTSVAPGEMSSCLGCHENRSNAPQQVSAMSPLAARKPAHRPEPIAGIPDVFDFPRDIQPILDKHCIECHNPDNRKGNVLLTGAHGPMYSHSYFTLTVHRQFVDGRNNPQSNYPPYALGAYPSPLMKKILNGHKDVSLSENEIKRIRYWIESAAAYPGTYAALGTGMIGGYQENLQVINSDHNWPESVKAATVIRRRCSECHKGHMRLPVKLSDERGISFWRPDWNDKALMLSRHIVFNLSRPDKSLILMAPLAKTAGGYAEGDKEMKHPHPVIFKDSNDADYIAILEMIRAGKRKLEQVKRFDMSDFKPRKEYIREMKRYGILPNELPADAAIDVYQTDQAYWQSLWYKPDETESELF